METRTQWLSLLKEDFTLGEEEAVDSWDTQTHNTCPRMKMAAHTSQSQRWSRLSKDKIPRRFLVERLILLQFSEVATFTPGVLEHAGSLDIQIRKHFQLTRMGTLTSQFLGVFMLLFSISWFTRAVAMCILWSLPIWERFIALEEARVDSLDLETSLLCRLMLIPVLSCLYPRRSIACKISLSFSWHAVTLTPWLSQEKEPSLPGVKQHMDSWD